MTRSNLIDLTVIYQTRTERASCVDTLRRLVRLNYESGDLYWLKRPRDFFETQREFLRWNTRYADAPALASINHGYRRGNLLGHPVLAHRVVFAIHHGRWPALDVDHIDGDKLNNQPSNLREATMSQNQANVPSRGGASRFCGVHARRSKWISQISDGTGGRIYLGAFETETAAAQAYDVAALARYGQFARLNFPEDELPPARNDVVTLTGPEWLLTEKGLL